MFIAFFVVLVDLSAVSLSISDDRDALISNVSVEDILDRELPHD